MLYEFHSRDGGVIEESFPVERRPRRIRRGGKWYYRVPGGVGAIHDRTRSFTSYQCPKHWEYAPRHDSEGRCVFGSRHEVMETIRKAKDGGEYVHGYDD